MSDEKKETISDIVADMRNEGHTGDASCLEWVGTKMRHYADRIEAAYNRLPLFTPEQLTAIAQQGCENFDLKRENARLRAALKPVLECDLSSNEDLCGMCAGREHCWPNVGEPQSWCDNKLMSEAVREARRIYNESEEKK